MDGVLPQGRGTGQMEYILPGLIEHIDDEHYHADSIFVTNSMLGDFLASPAQFYRKHILHDTTDEPTDSMRIGSALHCVVLEGREVFETRYAVLKKCDRRTKLGKAKWKEQLASTDGRPWITDAELVDVLSMALAVERNDIARTLIRNIQWSERVLYWDDPTTGIPCKGKLDALSVHNDTPYIVDLKTSHDSGALSWPFSARRFGYHRQAAFYSRGFAETFGDEPEFVFVVVSNKSPHYVSVYQMTEDSLVRGSVDYRRALNGIRGCFASGEWPESESVLAGQNQRTKADASRTANRA